MWREEDFSITEYTLLKMIFSAWKFPSECIKGRPCLFGGWRLEAETWRLMGKDPAWKIYWTRLIDLAGADPEGRRDNATWSRSKDLQLVSPWLSNGK